MDGVAEMPVGIASMHQTVLDGARGERWSRSRWMDGVEEMPVGIASMHQTVLDGAQWRKMVKI